MMRTLVVVMMLVACDAGAPAPPVPTTPTKTRTVTPRSKLPPAIQPLVPQHGIYAAGGGLMSAPWRVVVDTDANTIFAGSSQTPNSPSFGKLEHEDTKPLTAPNKQHLMQLANDAWSEVPPNEHPDPTGDYDELIVVADGDNTFYLEGYGPIHRPRAMKLIEELRAAGAL
jgi:hypothetical protein